MDTRSAARPIADRYRLERRIARGGMGQVWAAHDARLGRRVAVKLLHRALGEDDAARRRFRAEARAAARLAHPNVVAVYDSGSHGDIPYLVMELLPGRTFADEIAERPVSTERVRAVGEGVLAALDAAHAAGIIHRDIKPGNILLTEEGSAKVADFGIAKLDDGAVTASGRVLGSASYMAPERLQGREATPQSDLYSVGAVLYEALTGRPPFSADSPWGLARAIQEGNRPSVRGLRPDADPALADTVERALATDPEARFPSAARMSAAMRGTTPSAEATRPLEPSEPAEPTPTEPLPAEPTAPRRRRGRPLVAAVVAAALVLLLAVFVGGLLRGPSGPPVEPPEPGSATNPAPLEDALDRLEEAVRP